MKHNRIDYILFLIDEMIEEWNQPPCKYLIRKEQFDMMSYSRWAMEEAKSYIYNHRDLDPIDAMEEFLYTMEEFSANARTVAANTAFSTACDIANSILEVLRAME